MTDCAQEGHNLAEGMWKPVYKKEAKMPRTVYKEGPGQ